MRAGYGTVTVLFTDLVGSTDLLSRLGEATFDGVRRSHFSALRQAIGRHRGEEVKTLGDGVLAAFGSAADAVACAASVQQSVERWSRSGRAPLAVRVGLALGEVSFEDDDVFGAPVVEAARLVAAAGAGEILATSLVAMVAGGRSDARFVEVGPMELKGLPNPVAVCRVEWESAGGTTCPLPAFLTDVGRIFVGREPELERLAQLWKEAGAGERRLVLLAGEPGVGKTRLAAELAGNVHGEGALVLAGRCDEDLGVPYQPFVEALRHFVGHAAGDELRDDLGRHAGELARLVPELTHLVADLSPPLESDPETERYRLFDAVAAWLAGTSADDPLLLVLDDLQWAAKPTFLLLRHVLRSAEPMRLLVIGTYRDTDLGPGHPLTGLLADLRRDATVARLGLGGLDQLAVSSFVEQAAGHRLDDAALALATAVHKETEGNPFFVKEVLRHLTETGGIERRGSRWVSLPVDELGIPEGVREVVGKRLSRLSGDANRLLHTAAVVGAEFEPAILGAAGDFDEEGLMSALEEGTGARLLTEADSGRYRFAHALVRDTLYQGLSAVRRETLHRRVAEAIERGWAGDRDDDAPTLAHHWARAGPSAAGTVKAVEYATQAGDRAVAQLASEEAVGWYGQALELHAQGTGHADDRQTELLIRLGEAQKAAGLPSFRETLLEAAAAAQQRGDTDRLVRAALANNRGVFSGGGVVDAERVAVLEAAARALGERDSVARARVLATLALEFTFLGDWERRRRPSDDALAIARRLDDESTLAWVLVRRHKAIQVAETLTERLANTAEALELTTRIGHPVERFFALAERQMCLFEAGWVAEGDPLRAQMAEIATQLNQPALRYFTALNCSTREALAGRFDEAERLALETLAVGTDTAQPEAAAAYSALIFGLRRDQGRLAELEPTLAQAVAANPGIPALRAMLAVTYADLGRTEDARRLLAADAASHFSTIPYDFFWAYALTLLAETTAFLDDAESAAILADRLSVAAGHVATVSIGTSGAVDRYLGLLAAALRRYDQAEGYFRSACDLHARIGAPAWLARSRVDWAAMLLSRRRPGDVAQAGHLLGQGLATARQLGLATVEQRAVVLMEGCR